MAFSTKKSVRKLLNVRFAYTLKFAEITALIPFSTPTPNYVNYDVDSAESEELTMPKPLWDEWLGRGVTWQLQRRILPPLRWNQGIWGETIRHYLAHPVLLRHDGCGCDLRRS